MEMVQFVNNRLYGKYYPVTESEEYLKEHGEYFRQKVKKGNSFHSGLCLQL